MIKSPSSMHPNSDVIGYPLFVISATAGKRTAGLIGREILVKLSLTESAEFSEKNKKSSVHSAGSARYLSKVSYNFLDRQNATYRFPDNC